VQHKQQCAAMRAACDTLAACEVATALQLRVHERNSSTHSYTTEWLLITPPSNLVPFPPLHAILRLQTSPPPSSVSDALGCKRRDRQHGVWQHISVVVCGAHSGGGRGEGIDAATVGGASVLMRYCTPRGAAACVSALRDTTLL
jgi:hypothetical protein